MKDPVIYPADRLTCTFPEELPVSARAAEILELVRKNPVVIVCGATGSGKTTQLPKIALKAGYGRHGRIGCTQPRRIAAASLAKRVAAETGSAGSMLVGYKVRFDDATSKETVIKFMTDGILLAETRNDPLLRQYDCIILDEVHERSLNVDFLLGCMKLILQKRHDLKVIISSATLEAERMSAFFGNAPVVQVEGRTYPVEDIWLPPAEDADLPESVADGVQYFSGMDPAGDILVFLPGEREIRETAEMLKGRGIPPAQILPLFGRLSGGEQQRVFHPSGTRRIVLATNVAETSLTIPGIRCVIDTGLVRLSRYNPHSRIQELRVESISQASSKQRRGRCGRTRDGICIHLYSEDTFRESAEYTPPEIQRSGLAGVILQMASLGLPPLGEFPLIDEPAPALIHEGYRALTDIGALDSRKRLTETGKFLSAMPIDPHIGKMLLSAGRNKVLREMLVIGAFLSIQDPAERPFEKAADADGAHRKLASDRSDFLGILNLWNAVRKAAGENNSKQGIRRFAKANYYNYRRLHEWENLVGDLNTTLPNPLHERMQDLTFETDRVQYDLLHQCILSGIPRNLACFDPETRQFGDMAGKKYVIFPGSGLARRKGMPHWLLSFARMETSRVFARVAAEARPEWLERVAPDLCTRVYDAVHWDPETGFVYARERVRAGNLLIHPGRRRHYGAIDPAAARKVFIQEGIASGEASVRGTWLEEWSETVLYLRETEERMRRPDGLYDDVAAIAWFGENLPEDFCSCDAVRKAWNADRRSFLPPEDEYLLAEMPDAGDFPDTLKSSGLRFRLNYHFDPGEKEDGLFLTVPEEKLNLLDRFLPEYLVPGYLPWKVEVLLRGLTKSQRQTFMPLKDAVELFCLSCRDGSVFMGQPLNTALAEWLAENFETSVEPADFDDIVLPEYCVMKLVIVNDRGAVSKVLREYPSDQPISSAVSTALPAAKKWTVGGCSGWPCDLPESVTVSAKSDTVSYPALTESGEDCIGTKLFLKQSEALESHRKGLLRLFTQTHRTLVKQLRSDVKVDGKTQMTFFMDGGSWKEDLVQSVLLDSFGTDPWKIRTLQEYEAASVHAVSAAYELLQKRLDMLLELRKTFERVENALDRLRGENTARLEIEMHADFLFRKGFLRFTEALPEYPRYVRALALRAERAANNPAADSKKGADLKPWITNERLALDLFPEVRSAPGLTDYVLLVEEARINRYAPEIPVRKKTGVSMLEKAWDDVKLS